MYVRKLIELLTQRRRGYLKLIMWENSKQFQRICSINGNSRGKKNFQRSEDKHTLKYYLIFWSCGQERLCRGIKNINKYIGVIVKKSGVRPCAEKSRLCFKEVKEENKRFWVKNESQLMQ